MSANLQVPPLKSAAFESSSPARRRLAARLEPFDSYWQAPKDVEKGFQSFTAYYRANYLHRLPSERSARILVVSCGPGYLVDVLVKAGYTNVVGIDSDPQKIAYAEKHRLPCQAAEAFPFLEAHQGAQFDVIIPEQELNHLTVDETIEFLQLCRGALKPQGRVIVYAMNGANPLVGSENLSHNLDHFYNVTEYSLTQLLELGGFKQVKPFDLKLYVFWKNPLNYVGLAVTTVLELSMRIIFKMYGKNVKYLAKKIGAEATV